MNQPEAQVAAPPDDGHQGSFTRPQDVMEAHAADRASVAPALHTDPNRQHANGAPPLWLISGALGLLAIVIYFAVSY